MTFLRIFFLAVLLVQSAAAGAAIVTLYDDGAGNLPADQPWLLYGHAGGTATQTAVGAGVSLVSDQAGAAGYSNWLFAPPGFPPVAYVKNLAFPALDRDAGFTLGFQLTVNAESHANASRAGFSVILLGADKKGIELGFWGDRVWAQADDPLFTHAEEAPFNTTAAEVQYALTVSGDTYTLRADGNPLLQGAVRDYTAFGGLPYSLENFLFLGDDTGSGATDAVLGRVTLQTVPLPASGGMLLAALAVLGRRARPRLCACSTPGHAHNTAP